jgi:hypothetical protein
MGSFNDFVPGYTSVDCGPLRGPVLFESLKDKDLFEL